MNFFIGLIVLGILALFAVSIFAAANMGNHAKNFMQDFDRPLGRGFGRPAGRFDRKRPDPSSGFGGMVQRHVGAIIAGQIAGLILVIGIIGVVLTYLRIL